MNDVAGGSWLVASERIKSYKDLNVWQKAMTLAKEIYRATENFPKSETYGLTGQIRRAAVSVPSNIAEGCARRTTPEFMRFINIALGSLAELETQILLSQQLDYLSESSSDPLLQKSEQVGRMLQKLHESLLRKTTSH